MPDQPTNADLNTSTDDGKTSAIEGKAEGAETQAAKPADADKKFTQTELDALAAKVRREEKEKFERQQAKAQRDAEEAKAKEQGEYQKLADGYKRELDEIKPQAELLVAYQEAVRGLVQAEMRHLPDEVKEMAPALDDPLSVLAWLPNAKKLAAKLEGQPARKGAGQDPKPKTGAGEREADEAARARMRAKYAY